MPEDPSRNLGGHAAIAGVDVVVDRDDADADGDVGVQRASARVDLVTWWKLRPPVLVDLPARTRQAAGILDAMMTVMTSRSLKVQKSVEELNIERQTKKKGGWLVKANDGGREG